MYLKSGTGHLLVRVILPPLAPRSLNQGAFISERLEYQDVQQRLILPT